MSLRRLFVLVLLPCFGPLVYVLVSGVMDPTRYIKNWGMTSAVLVLGGGVFGLVGIVCLSMFQWNGVRLARPAYLAAPLLSFGAAMFLFVLKAGWFERDSLGILLYYTGWYAVFGIAAIAIPVVAATLLVWASRRYVFGRRVHVGPGVPAASSQSQGTMIDHAHAVAAAALLLVGVVVSHQLLYRLLVIPRLDGWRFVPLDWWLIVSLPMIIVGLAGGAFLVRGNQLALAAVLAAAATETYAVVAAMNHWPGFGTAHRVLLVEAAWLSSIRFVLIATSFGALLCIGWMIKHCTAAAVSAARRWSYYEGTRRRRYYGSVHQRRAKSLGRGISRS